MGSRCPSQSTWDWEEEKEEEEEDAAADKDVLAWDKHGRMLQEEQDSWGGPHQGAEPLGLELGWPSPARSMGGRLCCHIYLYMGDPSFELVPMLIGHHGCNMKHIAYHTKAKVRIRGVGSGHKEGDLAAEAGVPLMMAITTCRDNYGGFQAALQMAAYMLLGVEELFQRYFSPPQDWKGFCVCEASENARGAVLHAFGEKYVSLRLRSAQCY